jgi:hypothetical protein
MMMMMSASPGRDGGIGAYGVSSATTRSAAIGSAR